MSESGIDLDFDLLSPDDFSQDESDTFYELKSRILDTSRYTFKYNNCQ